MPQLYDRTTGRPRDVTPEQARELTAANPGKFTTDIKAPITDAEWDRMTPGLRGAAAMIRDRALKGL